MISSSIGLIYADSWNHIIGINGAIPWNLPDDLRRFKHITKGQTVVMGRLTWESLKKPLTGRLNVILSSKDLNLKEYTDPDTPVIQIKTIDEIAHLPKDRFTWIIGGERLLKDMLPFAITIKQTRIDNVIQLPPNSVVAKSPVINTTEWKILDQRQQYSTNGAKITYQYIDWIRRYDNSYSLI